jgi:hypothetical protein
MAVRFACHPCLHSRKGIHAIKNASFDWVNCWLCYQMAGSFSMAGVGGMKKSHFLFDALHTLNI